MKNLIIILLLGTVIFLLLSIFYQNNPALVSQVESLGGISTAPQRARAAARADRKGTEPVIIGVVGHWQDPSSISMLEGIRTAALEINETGGINGRKVKLMMVNDRNKLQNSKDAAQWLCNNPDVVAIIGGTFYHNFTCIAALCEFNGMLLISPSVTSQGADDKNSNLVFVNFPSITEFADKVSNFLKKRKIASVAVLSPSEYNYGYFFCNAVDCVMKRDIAGSTGVVARKVYYQPINRDLIFSAMKLWEDNIKYKSMLIGGNLEATKTILNVARNLKVNPVFILSDEMEKQQLAESKEIKGLKIFLPSVYNADSPKPQVKKFRKLYKKHFRNEPTVWSAQGYDTLMVLAAAMKNAKSTVPAEVAASMQKIIYRNNVSAASTISFNENGELKNCKIIMKYPENGTFKVVK